ncbi:Diguanylate cyclase/phosphodiesterase (GGDEF & EAL domains) with PAS/PAC sensor(s) [Lysobacter dokdonensis DS-58]|uniref:cyclic-guanylate-specific phosphodiesterase n=1 Tax=Lysobacter dokdonensis DS-58 TaxID=1300345 RepID=A0A0A2X4H1_9GAMM|nr:EAL domain-containing protein [Lysobacter dokdonensis]KGQ20114.1 Diguanylate cyclase/phosphodiesterase (GGDEF & EAL domains) with PAS/PAC sensor(s) [Lysobacter dokdonensis DS-58]
MRLSIFDPSTRAGERVAGVLFALALALIAPAASTWAATRDFHFRNIGSEHGLAQNTVTAFAQDLDGFVWVGTQGGLHRYDGQRYHLFRHDPRDPASLPDSYVTALAIEGRDAVWVGTYSEFVARLDLHDGAIKRFAIDGGAALPGSPRKQVLALLPVDGQLWVGTQAGLVRFDPKTGKSRDLLTLDPRNVATSPQQALLRDRDRAVWFGSASGLYRFGAGGGSERIAEGAVHSMGFDRDGRLWIGRADGLYRLRDDGRALLHVWPGADSGEVNPDVRAIVQAPDRRLWISVFGDGLRRMDVDGGHVQALRENWMQGALSESAIGKLMLDRGGALWVGGQFRGPSVTDPLGTRFRYLAGGEPRNFASGVAGNSVRAIVEDDARQWWFGTDNGELYRSDARGDSLAPVEAFTATFPSGPGYLLRVMGFARGEAGKLWMATTRGLGTIDTRTGVLAQVPLAGYPDVQLRSIARDDDGTLWIGSQLRGLLHFDPGSGRVRAYMARGNSPEPSTVHVVTVDRNHRVWAGSSDGLQLLEPVAGRMRVFRHAPDAPQSLAGNLVRAVLEASDGTIWIGTHSGLSRVREEGNEIRFEHPLDAALGARPVPVVFSIAESPQGLLWLGTDAGLMRFDPAHNAVRTFGMADGVQDLEFNGGSAARLRDGRLLFGGVRGLNLFDPRMVHDSAYMPPVRLLSARFSAGAATDQDLAWQPERIDVPSDAGLLRLRVGALDFADGGNIRYRYKLEGFDTDWIDNGAVPEITYTRVPPGDYTFLAQATNRDGVWNAQSLRLPVHVAPPMWRHPFALLAYAVAGLLLVGGVAWLIVQRRRREKVYFAQIRDREERLQLALWASGEMFWDYDLARGEMRSMRTSESDAARPGIAVQSEVDQRHEIHDDDLPRVLERLKQHLRGETPLFLSEHRVRGPNGAWTWVRARGRVVERGPDGRALRVAGTARDITAGRAAERERRIATEVLRSMSEAVAVLDRDFQFVSVNPAFSRISGYNETEVIGKSASLLDSAQHDPDFYRQTRAEVVRNGRWSGEMWQQRKDGEEFLCWIESSAVLDAGGQRSHYVAVFTDITDKKRAEQELRYLANYDTLTSLPNRALLSERLSRAIVRARRQESRIAVLFLDLDRFKDINDSLGHAAGDRILRATAARLQQTVGPQHTVARLGGDEFTVVLENIDTPEEAEKIAREIITSFEAPLDIDETQDVAITPSIGISLYPDNAAVPTDLLKHADTAMYQAKAAGRRIYMRYTESMEIAIRRRATISAALRKVLDRNELRLVFQPKLSLPQARITGVEALLRWTSPEYGEIPPAQFIPLAEESGLILEIGEWALREACHTLKRWRANGLDRLTMAVNVSALQLLRGDLPAVVARVLEDTGVPAEYLELELTESVVMSNAAQTAVTLQAIRELGVQLAVDDFGTGYSSLAYLKRLPITTLKIDKEFIGDLTRDADDEAITSTVITMAHSLGLNVVAEGVEEEAQVLFLRAHRCDEIQGYWLSQPLDAHRCLGLIRTWAPDLNAAVIP